MPRLFADVGQSSATFYNNRGFNRAFNRGYNLQALRGVGPMQVKAQGVSIAIVLIGVCIPTIIYRGVNLTQDPPR